MNDQEAVGRKATAERMLADPLFNEAWDALRGRLLHLMETAQTDEATLKAKLALGLLADLRRHWDRIVTDGKIAAESIRLEQDKRKWWQRAA